MIGNMENVLRQLVAVLNRAATPNTSEVRELVECLMPIIRAIGDACGSITQEFDRQHAADEEMVRILDDQDVSRRERARRLLVDEDRGTLNDNDCWSLMIGAPSMTTTSKSA